MATSVSDFTADAVVSAERPPESAGRNVGRDIGYIFRLLAIHLKHDRLFGPLLWILALALSSGGSYLGLQFALRQAAITNGLVAHDRSAVVTALGGLVIVLTFQFLSFTISTLVEMTLRIRIRTVLVNRLINKWLGGTNFYRPSHDSNVDHPEQRVQEDTYNFPWYAMQILPMLASMVVSFYLYSAQLWRMAKPLHITLAGGVIVIPKALYLISIGSAILVTILIHLFGRVFTRLEVVRQRIEAGFRHDLGQAREFAEQIVLSKGQKTEELRAAHDYKLIQRNWTPYSILFGVLSGLQNSAAQFGTIIPVALLFPFVLSGELKVGDLSLAGAAFFTIYTAFASFSMRYTDFAYLRSAAMRLSLMDRSLSEEQSSGIECVTGSGRDFGVDDLEVQTASGEKLLFLQDLEVSPGEKWLIRGKSGSGKSTLFRTLAGIWPFGAGTVRRPSGECTVMFLPQKPYLPNGSIAELLSYPHKADAFSTEQYQKTLQDLRLGHLSGLVDTPRAWSKILSPGEQQRICLGRALLQRPDFLFLDEATSSLDAQTEKAVLDQLGEKLRGSAIVSISHSDRSHEFQEQLLTVEDGRVTTVKLRDGGGPNAS